MLGLESGADYYLPKPFHHIRLNVCIKRLILLITGGGQKGDKLGNVFVNTESHRVTIGEKEVELLKKEYDILVYFMQRPNHLIDKSILAEGVWGDHIDQVDNFHFIYAQMKNLRHKLTKNGATIEIKSIYGFGYKLVLIDHE